MHIHQEYLIQEKNLQKGRNFVIVLDCFSVFKSYKTQKMYLACTDMNEDRCYKKKVKKYFIFNFDFIDEDHVKDR